MASVQRSKIKRVGPTDKECWERETDDVAKASDWNKNRWHRKNGLLIRRQKTSGMAKIWQKRADDGEK